MAYSFNFGGGSTNRSSYVYGSGHGVKSEYGGFPVGNINDGGWRPVKVYGISVIGLSGGYPLIWFGGNQTGGGGVFNSSGGGFAIRCISNSGTMYFGRLNDNGVNTIDEQDGSVWSPRGGICGWFDWATVALAPSMVDAVPGSAGAITVRFSGNGNTGGAGMTGWQLQYATNSAFTTGVVTIASSGTSTITGTPGQKYWFRSRGSNDVGWSQWSGAISATAIGVPSAVQSLTAGVSTTVAGAVNLSWTAPATPGGAITGYKIYRGGTLVHTTSGTGTSYTNTGLTKGTSYSYVVRARNAYSDSISSQGAASNTATITAQGTPGPPTGLTAIPDALNPGEIDLDWDAPTYTGVGGLTGYQVYSSTGTLINGSVPAGTTSYTVTGLSPGVSYGFFIRGKNAISTTSGTPGDNSTTVYASALGDPPQVTGVTVTSDPKVSGRLSVQWTDPDIGVAAVVGYTVFNAATGLPIGKVSSQKFVLDNLTPGTTYSFFVKARNTVTEQAGTDGGPQSATVSGAPGASSTQATGTVTNAITDNTNLILSGVKTISSVTSNTFTYTQIGPPVTSVTTSGTATDNTNMTLNGTYTIGTPTSFTITYSKTISNIPAGTVTTGTLLNNTNAAFNGTFTATAADSFDKTVSYALVGANVATVAVTGTVTNNTNATFNGEGFIIIGMTSNTFSYARVGADVTEISASGYSIDTTNRDYYNGTYEVLDVPAYNIFRYNRV